MFATEYQDDLVADLRTTIANVMDIDESLIKESTLFIEDLGMESLMALEIMVALEKKYGVKLKEAELREMTCLNAVVNLLEKLKDRQST